MSLRPLSFATAVAALLLLAALVSLLPVEAAAQCALCRTALQNAAERTARTMNLGILMLLIPPVAIFCAIFAVALKGGKEEEEG